jgi:8-oxo-dGTP pyrophosphatase MutT (NUDIX family)
MRLERSAGFIVFRDQPSSAGTGGRLYLLLDYGRHWDYPKGHIEKGEDDAAAALRELHEETGIEDVQIIPGFARKIVYFFRGGRSQASGGKPAKPVSKALVKKEVIFFLGRAATEQVQLSKEHCGFAYLPYEQALQRLTFANAREVLRAAEQFLDGAEKL